MFYVQIYYYSESPYIYFHVEIGKTHLNYLIINGKMEKFQSKIQNLRFGRFILSSDSIS